MMNKIILYGPSFQCILDKIPLNNGQLRCYCVRLTLKAPYPNGIDTFGTTVKYDEPVITGFIDFSRVVLLIRRTPTTRQIDGVIPR